MTLILGMSKREGVYLSVDYRVSIQGTGEVVDDDTVKFLTVRYPGEPDTLIAYTGVAYLRDGTPVGDWIRETLRGQNDVIDVSMAHLLARLNRDIAPMREPLIVNVLVVEEKRRLFGALSNVKKPWNTMDSFEYVMQELTEPLVFASGSGAWSLVEQGHIELLRQQMYVWPRRFRDHMKLLATISRRVAEVDESLSPHCHVAFIHADDPSQSASEVFSDGHIVPFHVPVITQGLDLSAVAPYLLAQLEQLREGGGGGDLSPNTIDEMNRALQRRP